MKLTLPLPPNRANAREHWRTTHRKKSAYYQKAMADIFQQTTAVQRSATERDHFTATVRLYVWSVFDDDNATALCKWPIDALRQWRLIYSDKRPHFALSGIPTQVIDRKNQRLEITLSPA